MEQQKTKIPYRSYIIKLSAMLLLFVTVTYCWFVFSKDATLNTLQVQTVGVVNVTISDVNQFNWNNKINVGLTGKTVTEYSGNGETLYKPITSNYEVEGFYLEEDSLTYVTGNEETDKEFIELIAYVKTDGPIKFYLGQDSTVTPDNSNVKNEEEKAKLDLIAGALRVAIIVDDYKPFIWAPNSTYEYDATNNTYKKDGTPEEKFTYVFSEVKDQFVEKTSMVTIQNPDLLASGVSEDKRFVWGDLANISNYVTSVDPIFKTDQNLNSETVIKIVIRIWVEGTDREAVKSVIGGKFNFNLTFTVTDNN